MKRIIALLLAFCAPLPASGAGILNGTTADLIVEVASAAPDYPILMACWFKPANVTSRGTLLAMSDDGAGGSLDALVLEARGDVAGDKINAASTAAGASSEAATSNGFEITTPVATWYLAVGYFEDDSTRKALLSSTFTASPTWSNEETTQRAAGNLDTISVGALRNGTASNFFSGDVAHAAIFTGVPAELVDTAVKQLASGLPPSSVRLIVRDYLYLYQPLKSAANESGSVGPTMTAANVTFDTDYPATHGHLLTLPTNHGLFNTGLFQGRWPFVAPTPGPLPPARLVTMDAESLALASESDTNVVGATRNLAIGYGEYASGRQCIITMTPHWQVPLLVEVASGVTIDEGDEVYQAADGKISDIGTVRVGVAVTGGTAGQTVKIIPR